MEAVFCMAKGIPNAVKVLIEIFNNFLYLLPFSMYGISWKSLNLQGPRHRSAFGKPVFLVIIFNNFDSLVILVLKMHFCIIWVVCS